ncbi:MAG TPA: antitoxin VapB family protein [Methanothrix sp.]|nr:antitoxin VapB family protein [Methanothrix sp.]
MCSLAGCARSDRGMLAVSEASLIQVSFYICACIHRYMASRNISIKENVYDMLNDARRNDESFSDVIERLIKRDKKDLSEYFGALRDSPLLDELEADSRKIREMARPRT